MKTVLLSMAVLFCSITLFAGTPAERLTESVQAVDESVQQVELNPLLAELSKLLNAETGVVEKALFYQNLKLSEVALAKFVAEKSGQPIESVLKPSVNWTALLEEKKVSLNDAREYLDNLASEVAFIVFEHRNAQKK